MQIIHRLILFFLCLVSNVTYSQEALKLGSNADHIAKQIENRDTNRIGTQLPAFVATELNGEVFTNISSKKITFYYFWNNCGDVCYRMFPEFNKMQKEFGEKVAFISITPESKERLTEVIQEYPFNFKHCMMPQDEIDMLRLSFGYPTTIITVDNSIVYCKSGGEVSLEAIKRNYEDCKAVINQYLD